MINLQSILNNQFSKIKTLEIENSMKIENCELKIY
jgi:hypothetical protein